MKVNRHSGKTSGQNRPAGLLPRIIAQIAIGLFCLNIFSTPRLQAQEVLSEYQVKAAFLFNFLKFVEWPADAFADPFAPIVIGIVGADPFGDALPQVIVGKTIQGRDLVIRRYRSGESLKNCHILFINAEEKKRFPQIIAGLSGTSVLTVADVDGFLDLGGIIQFRQENNHIRFAINVDAAAKSRLKISSKLLSLGWVQGTAAGGTAK